MAKDRTGSCGSLFSTEVELYNALLELSHDLSQQHALIHDSTEKSEDVILHLNETIKRLESFMQTSELANNIDSANFNMCKILQSLIAEKTDMIGREINQALQHLVDNSAEQFITMKKEIENTNDELKKESALPFYLASKKNFNLVLSLMIFFILSAGVLSGCFIAGFFLQTSNAKNFHFIEQTNEPNKYIIDTEKVTVDASKDGKKLILKVQ